MTVPKIWRAIPEYYNLIGSSCSKCGAKFFPKRIVCKECGYHDLQPYDFKGSGEIETFTVIRTPIDDDYEKAARVVPYVLAIIKLSEGPRITTQIIDCDIDDVQIGKKVQSVFRKITEQGEKGVIQYGYKFRMVG